MKLETLPKVLTDAQVDSICLSIRHDFGLIQDESVVEEYKKQFGFRCSGMTEKERDELRQQVREFYHAIYKQFFFIERQRIYFDEKELEKNRIYLNDL